MPFPGYPLAAGYTNATPKVNAHPTAHNDLVAAVNDLQAQIAALLQVDQIVTSATRPVAPAAGWKIYETDTKTMQVYDGTAWQQFFAGGGAWTAYTPVDSNITVGSGTRLAAYRMLDPKTCMFRWHLILSSSTIAANANIGLPFNSVAVGTNQVQVVPSYYLDTGTRNFIGVARISSGLKFGALIHTEAGGSGGVDGSNPFVWANGDTIAVQGVYEIA